MYIFVAQKESLKRSKKMGLLSLFKSTSEEWKGPWSDGSKEWTAETREKLGVEKAGQNVG